MKTFDCGPRAHTRTLILAGSDWMMLVYQFFMVFRMTFRHRFVDDKFVCDV